MEPNKVIMYNYANAIDRIVENIIKSADFTHESSCYVPIIYGKMKNGDEFSYASLFVLDFMREPPKNAKSEDKLFWIGVGSSDLIGFQDDIRIKWKEPYFIPKYIIDEAIRDCGYNKEDMYYTNKEETLNILKAMVNVLIRRGIPFCFKDEFIEFSKISKANTDIKYSKRTLGDLNAKLEKIKEMIEKEKAQLKEHEDELQTAIAEKHTYVPMI